MNTPHLSSLLSAYIVQCTGHADGEDQRQLAEGILHLVETKPDTYWKRSEFTPGHVTASAWVVNAERTHVLLVRHLTMHRLLQLGGHVEPYDADIHAAALREVHEESGLVGTITSGIYDVDINPIPHNEKKNEPAHKHYDIRFLVECPFVPPTPPAGESADIGWYSLAEIAELEHEGALGTGAYRMVRKM